MRALIALLLCSFAGGCATTGGGRTTSDGWSVHAIKAGSIDHVVRWRSGAPGAGWARDPARTADFAWTHDGLAAVIYGDTTCGEKYDDVPLTVLVNHLTFGFEHLQTDEQVPLELAGRAALRRVMSASLDGRPVRVASTVVKKGPCIFDLTYVVARPDRFAEGWEAYERVVSGLVIEVQR